MTPYFIIFICILLADISKNKSIYLYYFIVTIVGLFLCTGYMVGSDWRVYELYYNNLQINDFDVSVEIGYLYLMKLFIFLGFNFWEFFIILKFILYAITIKFIKDNSDGNFYLSLLIYFSYLGIFCFIDNPMRYLISSTLFLYAIKYIISGRLIFFLLIITFCSMFHYSFIAIFPIYFICRHSYSAKFLLIIFIIFNIAAVFFAEDIFIFIIFLSSLLPNDYDNLNRLLNGYLIDQPIGDRIITLGLISKYFIFGILLLGYKKIVIPPQQKKWNVFFNFSILSLFIIRCALVIPIIFRYAIPIAAIYSIVLSAIVNNNKGNSRLLIYIAIVVISGGSIFQQITTDYRFVPYSSYLTFLFTDKPYYDYRIDYNHIFSPYEISE